MHRAQLHGAISLDVVCIPSTCPLHVLSSTLATLGYLSHHAVKHTPGQTPQFALLHGLSVVISRASSF